MQNSVLLWVPLRRTAYQECGHLRMWYSRRNLPEQRERTLHCSCHLCCLCSLSLTRTVPPQLCRDPQFLPLCEGEPGSLDSIPWWGSHHQLQLWRLWAGVCRRCREGIRCCSSWHLLPVFLSPTIKVLTGRNGWRPKQGILEGASSRHLFSSVLFKEIPTLDCPCSRWLRGTWNQPQAVA